MTTDNQLRAASKTANPGDGFFAGASGERSLAPSPLVSVVVPCRNEARFIGGCLDSILANDYDAARVEVLVIDGASDDGTPDIVSQYAKRDGRVRLLHNPRRITPAALNVGIRAALGDVIVRMDAHNAYPPTYISSLIGWLRRSGADNVGGIWITQATGHSPVARAIALGLSHPFGVGNSYFRIGSTNPRWVDNVPFGCYRREVFDRIGLFDEDLVRNQDDELNLRLVRAGGRILLVPSIVSYYHSRPTLTKLARMNFQYGYFKPLVIRKIGAVMTVRQVVPATFVASLVVAGILAPFSAVSAALFVGVAGTYAVAAAISAIVAVPRHGVLTAAALAAVFPTMHVSYGVGFLRGLYAFFIRRQLSVANGSAIPITR